MITKAIKQVVIVGGTHGNEFTGAYLIKKFEQYPDLIKRSSFETLTLLANPRAFAATRRYIDRDLNRSFHSDDLQNPNLWDYEAQRAKTIAQQIGNKGNTQVDVIIDLHSTTANMGLSLLVSNLNQNTLQLAAYLTSIEPLVKVCWTRPNSESVLLRSLCDFGLVIEVGPVAQGVLDANWFEKTERLVYIILDYLQACNQGMIPAMSDSFTLYETIEAIDYPRNQQGEIQAMIHPQLQGRDYEPLHLGEPMFLGLDGEAIAYAGTSTVYPVFINEAAYYEKGIAMYFAKKRQITVKT